MSDYTLTARTNYVNVEPQHLILFEALSKILGAELAYKRGRFDTALISLDTREVADTYSELDHIADTYELTTEEVQALQERALISTVDKGYRITVSLANLARCISDDSTLIYTELVDASPVALNAHAEAINNKGLSIATVNLNEIYNKVQLLTGTKPTEAHD